LWRPLLDLPRPVWLLGWVSLATDAASEAIYPLMPFFLTRVLGAGAVSLGLVEGAAEAVNSAIKILAGRAADRARFKWPLVLAGYALSSLVRPFMALARSWVHVFSVRVIDRVGKGVRGAPRDAMLAGWTTDDNRGLVYGFHRAMDHAGAVVGPVVASVFLLFYPGEYRTLFALAILPGAVAVLLVFFVREREGPAPPRHVTPLDTGRRQAVGPPEWSDVISASARAADSFHPADAAVARLPRRLKSYFLVLSLFTLGNSSDAFLLLKLSDVAGSVQYVPLMWAALHLVKAGFSVVGGSWSDRVGRRAVISTGWMVYAGVYVGFAVSDSLAPLLACFLAYGLYFGFTEGTEKALIADLSPSSRRGFAFGLHNAVTGLGALAASVLFGVLWSAFGPAVAFGTGAALAVAAIVLLNLVIERSA
jgi:MFS family permease